MPKHKPTVGEEVTDLLTRLGIANSEISYVITSSAKRLRKSLRRIQDADIGKKDLQLCSRIRRRLKKSKHTGVKITKGLRSWGILTKVPIAVESDSWMTIIYIPRSKNSIPEFSVHPLRVKDYVGDVRITVDEPCALEHEVSDWSIVFLRTPDLPDLDVNYTEPVDVTIKDGDRTFVITLTITRPTGRT